MLVLRMCCVFPVWMLRVCELYRWWAVCFGDVCVNVSGRMSHSVRSEVRSHWFLTKPILNRTWANYANVCMKPDLHIHCLRSCSYIVHKYFMAFCFAEVFVVSWTKKRNIRIYHSEVWCVYFNGENHIFYS